MVHILLSVSNKNLQFQGLEKQQMLKETLMEILENFFKSTYM